MATKIEDKINERERGDSENANAVAAAPSAPAEDAGRPGFQLEGQSEADAGEAERQRELEAEARKERAERNKADIQELLAEKPFQFGVGSKEAKTVQADIFNQPPTVKQEAPPAASELTEQAARVDKAGKVPSSETASPVPTRPPRLPTK